jgi:hypothetical protein
VPPTSTQAESLSFATKLKQNSINMLVIFNGDDARFAAINRRMKNILVMKKLCRTFLFAPPTQQTKGRRNYEKRLQNNHNFVWWISIVKLELKQLREKIWIVEKVSSFAHHHPLLSLVAAVINFPKIFLIKLAPRTTTLQRKIFKNLHHSTRETTKAFFRRVEASPSPKLPTARKEMENADKTKTLKPSRRKADGASKKAVY